MYKGSVFVFHAILILFCGDIHAAPLSPLQDAGIESATVDREDVGNVATNRSLELINELSNRRRLHYLFANPQIKEVGLQQSYVNVHEGNLTFMQRDLVLVDTIPIVVGRVYDSRISVDRGFGPGWKLASEEYIDIVAPDDYEYVDANNNSYKIADRGGVFAFATSTFSSAIAIDVAHDEIHIADHNFSRTFRRTGRRFVLTEVIDRHGNWLRIDYIDGAISTIKSSNGRLAKISRNSSGRIVKIADDAERTVVYSYTETGLLSASTLLSGQSVSYQYDTSNRLIGITDSRQAQILAADYDKAGRANRVTVLGQPLVLQYLQNMTQITNARGRVAEFYQDRTGTTTAVRDYSGVITGIDLQPGSSRPTKFNVDDVTLAKFAYTRDGLVSNIAHSGPDSDLSLALEYHATGHVSSIKSSDESVAVAFGYTDTGRLANIRYADGYEIQYSWATNGRPESAKSDKFSIRIESDRYGRVTAFSRGSGSYVGIVYDQYDRVAEIRTSNMGSSEYSYAKDKFRVRTEYDDGSIIETSYDSAGNVRQKTQKHADGGIKSTQYVVAANNTLERLIPSGGEEFRFNYDELNRATSISIGDRKLTIGYDEQSRVTNASLDGVETVAIDYRASELDIAHNVDSRTFHTTVTQSIGSGVYGTLEEIAYTRPQYTPYQAIGFDQEMNRMVLRSLEDFFPEKVLKDGFARRNLPIAEFEFIGSIAEFDKPSSALFVPPEYSSVNCYVCDSYILDHQFNVQGSLSGSATLAFDEYGVFSHSATIIGCRYQEYGPPVSARHQIFFGDGTSATYYSPGGGYGTAHTYFQSGAFTARSEIECPCGVFGFSSKTKSVKAIDLQVQSASIATNNASVMLKPTGSGTSGTLKLEVLDPAAAYTTSTTSKSGGTHSVGLNRANIPVGEYKKVRATWTVNGAVVSDVFDYHFRALGTYRHSQYNTPNQSNSTCSTGTSSTSYITTESGGVSQCFNAGATYYTVNLPNIFKSQVLLNGSGKTTAHGDVQWDQFCPTTPPAPPGSGNNTFRKKAITPSCAGGTLSSNTVAVLPGHQYLSCGDTIYIHGVGTKTVTDSCPGCLVAQADNYTLDGRCTSVPDVGNFATFELY